MTHHMVTIVKERQVHKLIRPDHLQHARDLMGGEMRIDCYPCEAPAEATAHAAIVICEQLDTIIEILLQQFGPCSAAEQTYPDQEATC